MSDKPTRVRRRESAVTLLGSLVGTTVFFVDPNEFKAEDVKSYQSERYPDLDFLQRYGRWEIE